MAVQARLVEASRTRRRTREDAGEEDKLAYGAQSMIKTGEARKLFLTRLAEMNKITQCGEVAPPGWEGTVKAMKGHPEIDNPFALAWYMQGQGDAPHK